MAVALPSANASRYELLCGGEPGIDPYTRTVSDLYQDVFYEGSFIGKGIYDLDMFERVLGQRLPDNQILSHDLLEGCYLRAGLLSDSQLYEEYPARYDADVSRRQRWIRGDWQLVGWLLGRVPGRAGKRERNPLSMLSRWKLFDNLRRSVVAPATDHVAAAGVGLLAARGLLERGRAGRHLPAARLFGPVRSAAQTARHPVAPAPGRLRAALRRAVFARHADPRLPAVRSVDQPGRHRAHPVAPAGVAQASARLARLEPAQLFRLAGGQLARHVVLARAGAGRLRRLARPGVPAALPAAAVVLLLWLAAPAIAWWISRPIERAVARLSAEQGRFLHGVARKTWAYFDTFVGPDDHWLPPDNMQEHPTLVVAHRTSPTNIGLALLANLTAYDFGYITDRPVDRAQPRHLAQHGRAGTLPGPLL